MKKIRPHSKIKNGLDWPIVISLTTLHLLAPLAFLYWSLSGFILCILLYVITCGGGIGFCYHRLLTHKSFKTSDWMRYLFTVIGTLTLQGNPIRWVATHRKHHKHTDTDDDPHSPLHGLWWAHVKWMFYKESEEENVRLWAPDLLKDKGMVFIDRYSLLPQILLALILYGLGFWIGGNYLATSWILWAIVLRTVLVFHATWSVNSMGHTIGYRNFNTPDTSTNVPGLEFLVFGENYHNNHHEGQAYANHGRGKYEIDLTFLFIRFLEKCGLVSDVRISPPLKK